jgi:hypothetical protein
MDNPQDFDQETEARLNWTETFMLIFSFFLLLLPRLLILLGATALVTILVMFWLK